MKYINFKRYKFSTVTKYIINIGNNLLKVFKSVSVKALPKSGVEAAMPAKPRKLRPMMLNAVNCLNIDIP